MLDGNPGLDALEDGLLGGPWAEAVAGQQNLAAPTLELRLERRLRLLAECRDQSVDLLANDCLTVGGVLQVDALGTPPSSSMAMWPVEKMRFLISMGPTSSGEKRLGNDGDMAYHS